MKRWMLSLIFVLMSFQAAYAEMKGITPQMCGKKDASICYGVCSVNFRGAGMKECVADCQQNGIRCEKASGTPQEGIPEAEIDARKVKQCMHLAASHCFESKNCQGMAHERRRQCQSECKSESKAECGG